MLPIQGRIISVNSSYLAHKVTNTAVKHSEYYFCLFVAMDFLRVGFSLFTNYLMYTGWPLLLFVKQGPDNQALSNTGVNAGA
jgi:hypothetical protein